MRRCQLCRPRFVSLGNLQANQAEPHQQEANSGPDDPNAQQTAADEQNCARNPHQNQPWIKILVNDYDCYVFADKGKIARQHRLRERPPPAQLHRMSWRLEPQEAAVINPQHRRQA
jgi:hypothetical protein